uniref:Kelch-like family member 3 n=1 Tax=Electrophorus electricus TaxID=8005 RepID=A0AAY5ELV5_ELEEL
MTESKAPCVEIRDMDGQTLRKLVDYIYTAEIEVSEDSVQVLLAAAGLLQLMDVRQACCEFLQSQLHPTNCLGIRAFADLHTCTDLLRQAHAYAGQCADHGPSAPSLRGESWTAGQLSNVRACACAPLLVLNRAAFLRGHAGGGVPGSFLAAGVQSYLQ